MYRGAARRARRARTPARRGGRAPSRRRRRSRAATSSTPRSWRRRRSKPMAMDFYVVLGLAPGASTADIKRAYRRLARRYHPGINPGDRAAEALFQRITEAYETLSDPARRQQYDAAAARRRRPARRSRSSSPGSISRSPRTGTQAATFSELFAEVLHPVAPADAGRPEAGRGSARVADRARSWTRCAASSARSWSRARRSCTACEGTGQRLDAGGRCGRARRPAACAGPAATWCFRSRARRAAAPAGSGQQRCAVCGAHGRVGAQRGDRRCACRPGVVDGARLRVPRRDTPAGTAAGPATCT